MWAELVARGRVCRPFCSQVRTVVARLVAGDSVTSMARRSKTVSSAPTPGAVRRRFRRAGPGEGTVVLADAPPVLPDVPPVAPPPQSASAATVPTPRRQSEGGRELFLVDVSAGLALANEARHRTLERVFGIRRSDANLLTGVMALMVANSVYEKVAAAGRPKPPPIRDVAIGLGVLRESIYGVAGPAASDTPLAGTLIALAVLVGLTREPVTRSLHGMRSSSRRAYRGFRGRYGHLIPRGVEEHLPGPA